MTTQPETKAHVFVQAQIVEFLTKLSTVYTTYSKTKKIIRG
jgi:hypothetical protein